MQSSLSITFLCFIQQLLKTIIIFLTALCNVLKAKIALDISLEGNDYDICPIGLDLLNNRGRMPIGLAAAWLYSI